jgi:hypothetical protein
MVISVLVSRGMMMLVVVYCSFDERARERVLDVMWHLTL